MKCPSCGATLRQYKYHGLVVDMCSKCSGIWFDPGEMKEYIEFFLKDRDDIPDAKIEFGKEVVGDRQVTEPSKSCPRCDVQMRSFNYAYDSNIILDRCYSCEGIWTDGEEIYKLAIYTKGNPRLQAMADSLMEMRRKSDQLKDLAELGQALTERSGAWAFIFLPKIILPLGDDVRASIIPVSVIGIILANVIVFASQLLFVADPLPFVKEYGLVPAEVMAGNAYFPFVSSMFIHAGLFHLLVNMFYFWIFGDNVEEAFGHLKFILFYFLFGFSASVLHILTRMGSTVPAVGASGAIAGLMGAYFVFHPHAKMRTLIIYRIINVPAYLYLGVWIVFQMIFGAIYQSLGVQSGVAWFAHIGGFASGVVLGWFWKRMRK